MEIFVLIKKIETILDAHFYETKEFINTNLV